MKTKVIFRKWKDGTIDALFPELADDIQGIFCVCYTRIGQHGGADYHGVIGRTKLASEPEYKSLYNELTRIGYDLQVIKNAPKDAHNTRKQFIQEMLK